jgi:replicative DNA helicase
MTERPDHNIGLRLNGVIGIDVDNYSKGGIDKRGWQTLQLAEARWGKLPPTWRSTARPATGASGIYFFRVPEGYLGLVSQLKLPDANGEIWSDIEICQYHHRYAVVWPSTNPETGTQYVWYDPAGNRVIGVIPRTDELPVLSEAWFRGLLELGRAEDPTLARDPVAVSAQRAPRAEWHPLVEATFGRLIEAASGAVEGSRHDNVLLLVGTLARWEEQGFAGATSALEGGGREYVALVTDRESANDYQRMVNGGRQQAADTTSTRERVRRLVAEMFADISHPTIGIGRREIVTEAEDPEPKPRSRLVPGGSIFDEPDITPAVWGSATEVLWAEGEPCMIAAPPGVGKTTLAGQLVLGMCGVPGFETLLDLPITPRARVLYVAADRPRQIMRSLRRQAPIEHRALLDEHLIIWKGPPPRDLAAHPDCLLLMAQEAEADVVVLDSLKDMVVGITEDKPGQGLNMAIQIAIAEGVEVLALHHQRKGQNDKKPNTLEDVYGSMHLTAGMGSVVLLWGQAGDMAIELVHLKQPSEAVGPLQIEHDHTVGRTSMTGGRWDALAYLRNVGPAGATTKEAAHAWFNKTPNRAEQMRAQRKLDGLVQAGLATVDRKGRGGRGGSDGAIYRWVDKGR